VKICFAIEALSRNDNSHLPTLRTLQGDERVAACYRFILPILSELLDRPEDFWNLWGPEYGRLEESETAIAKGDIRVSDLSEDNLTKVEIVNFPASHLHSVAIHNRTQCYTTLLLDGPAHNHAVKFRYEQVVEYHTKHVPRLVDLSGIVHKSLTSLTLTPSTHLHQYSLV